jgi:hypothetical protein
MFARHFVRRVLCNPEFARMPPVDGLDVASDMSVHDALLFAWRGCKTLNAAMNSTAIDVSPQQPEIVLALGSLECR